MYLQSNRPSIARDVTHWQQKNYSCFFSYHTMVGKNERTCLSNIVSIGINSLKRKHQQLKRKVRHRPFIFLSVATVIFSHMLGESSLLRSYGASVTGRFCFKVSMRDKTPLFTLVVTLLVTESAGGGGGRTFCEGGLATKHFWYRNCNKTKPFCNHYWIK